MLAGLIEFSLKNRFLILCLAGLVAFLGGWTALHLPIDAVPDMTNVQVTVVTEAGSLSPVEVERYITYPVEMALGGLPHLEETPQHFPLWNFRGYSCLQRGDGSLPCSPIGQRTLAANRG